jgi:hypothetical protein
MTVVLICDICDQSEDGLWFEVCGCVCSVDGLASFVMFLISYD